MSTRNYGIDFLRIVSMFMVVLLHIMGQGGILNAAEPYSLNYYVAWFLEISAYCAVNCFAMISGFVMCFSKTKLSKISELWLQTAFYTISILVVFFLISPQNVSLGSVVNAVFPITRNHYWYITAYFGLYLLIPILNVAIQKIEKKVFSITLASAFVLMTILPTILLYSTYNLSGGYSMIWLCMMYLLGGYIRKYDIVSKIKGGYACLIYSSAIVLTFIYKFAIEHLTPVIFGNIRYDNLFTSYVSPTIVLAGFGLFIACTKIKFNTFFTKVISIISPAALGVYLIHVNSFVWTKVIDGFSEKFATGNVATMIIGIFVSAIVIYLACTIIELLRIQLFKLIRIKNLCQHIESFTYKTLNKIYIKVFK